MDPNWFYSTLAQSTSAIVGLAGGFLFAWLLSRRSEIMAERSDYMANLQRVMEQLEGLKNRAESRRTGVETTLRKIHEQRARSVDHQNLIIPEFELLSHSAYKVAHPSEDDLRVLETVPKVYEELRNAIGNTREELARCILKGEPLPARGVPRYRGVEMPSNPFLETGIGPENFWSGLRLQEAYSICQWQQIANQYDKVAADTQAFRARLVPNSIYFVIFVLSALVAGGIVAPLAFLSAEEGRSKWILFSIFAPLVLAFVGYLGYEVWRLRHAADLSRDSI
jgi:hypothetical protein